MPDVAQYRVSPGLNIDPVANPLLFGTESADDIAAALVDNARLASIAADYRSFIHSYFAGTDPSDSIADLVSLIEEHLG
jgi:CDP-ribitol ribitolphosphotransferase